MPIKQVFLEDSEEPYAPPGKVLGLSVVGGEAFIEISRYQETHSKRTVRVLQDEKAARQGGDDYPGGTAGTAQMMVNYDELIEALRLLRASDLAAEAAAKRQS